MIVHIAGSVEVYSPNPGSIFNLPFRPKQYHIPTIPNSAQHQTLTHQIRNLLRRKVNHSHHLPTNKLLRRVQGRYLRGSFPQPMRAKIHRHFIGGVSGFFKYFCCDNGADAHLDAFKFLPAEVSGFHIFHV